MSQQNNTTTPGFVAPTPTGTRTTPATTLPKANPQTVGGITTATELAASTTKGQPTGSTNNPTRLNTATAAPILDRIQPKADATPNVKPGHNPKAV